MDKLERLLLSLWIGVMVGVGYIATPVLFKNLEDRSFAGSLAGQMFEVVGIIGLICGVVILALRYKDIGAKFFSQWRGLVLLVMLILVAAGMFVLQPMIADVKALGLTPGSDAASQFKVLHGISSLVYMITIICGCVLIFAGLKKVEKVS